MKVTILHNSRCATSRAVLQMIRDAGHMPEIVEYLKHPPSRSELVNMMLALDLTPLELMRRKDKLFAELDLGADDKTDNQLLDAMLANPILIERPIVLSEKGIRLARPKERVLDIL